MEENKTIHLDEASFWVKLGKYSSSAGINLIEKALWLYFAYKQPNTPQWAKAAIYGALVYFISPFDAIVDLIPGVGYSDDLGVLALAVTTVALYINQEVKDLATEKLKVWFQ